MSIQGTFNTAVQGMNTEGHALSVISTNIANVATTGYKTQNTHFETILNHIRPNNQKFLTVQPVDFRDVSAQGQIETTQRTYDLALNGRGFMITNTQNNGSGIWQYTRDGALFGKATNVGTTAAPVAGTTLMTSGGSYIYGWAANADGSFTETPSLSALTPITYSTDAVFAAKPSDTITLQANVSGETSGRQTVTVPYVDTLGNSRTITLGFTAVPGAVGADGTVTSTYDLDFTDSNGSTVTADTVRTQFGKQAQLIVPSTGNVQLTLGDPASPQVINLDLSRMTDFKDQGQITVQSVDDNGYIEGRLKNVYFNSEGVLLGSYTNGELKPLYKLPVATFAAEDMLEAKPGNYFTQTADAGQLDIRGLGAQSTNTGGTAFVAGALERSTVDLADQFSRMIITQRAYSSNAQVLRTADEMTQAVRDIKR